MSQYRDDLAAAHVRIEQLETELGYRPRRQASRRWLLPSAVAMTVVGAVVAFWALGRAPDDPPLAVTPPVIEQPGAHRARHVEAERARVIHEWKDLHNRPGGRNIALGKPVIAGNGARDKLIALTDGLDDGSVYYGSAYTISATVDLGDIDTLGALRVVWGYFGCSPLERSPSATTIPSYDKPGTGDLCNNGHPYIDRWTVSVSDDGTTFDTVGTGAVPHSRATQLRFDSVLPRVRFVRVEASSSSNWIGLYELGAFAS